LLVFLISPEFQVLILKGREFFATISTSSNYLIALLIAFFICIIGNASFGFPIPYPFILFSLSNSIYLEYHLQGYIFSEILFLPSFLFQLLGIILSGGLGSAVGELTSFIIGKKAKDLTSGADSKVLKNMDGFGRLVLENPKRTYLYIFIAAALPIPDDPLWAGIGLAFGDKRKTLEGINTPEGDPLQFSLTKSIFAAWIGKNFTTLFYVAWPIFIAIGLTASGIELNDTSSVITEAIVLLVTITMMYFIMAFDWEKYTRKRESFIDKSSE
jgi:hypothetical protein